MVCFRKGKLTLQLGITLGIGWGLMQDETGMTGSHCVPCSVLWVLTCR